MQEYLKAVMVGMFIIFSLILTGCSNTSTVASDPTLSSSAVPSDKFSAALKDAKDQVSAAVAAAETEITSVRVANMGSGDLQVLYEEIMNLINQYKNPELFSSWVNETTPTSQDAADLTGYSHQLVTVLQELVDDWVDGVLGVLNTQPEGETPDARVNRLQTTMGLVLTYRFGECETVFDEQNPEDIAACYNPGDDYYTITPTGLAAGDCQLRKTLAHEYRHYEQWKEGMMVLPDLPNRDELEADAVANEWRGGC